MAQQANTQQVNVRKLSVDGIGEDGNFAGDGQGAPFVVFDVDQQENIAGPFTTRSVAGVAMAAILAGAAEELHAEALSDMLEAIDNPAGATQDRPILDPQETRFTATGDGTVTVNDVLSIHKSERVSLVNIATKQKHIKVSAVGGNGNVPTISICADDDSDTTGTEVELFDFPGWTVWSASASKHSVQVALFLN